MHYLIVIEFCHLSFYVGLHGTYLPALSNDLVLSCQMKKLSLGDDTRQVNRFEPVSDQESLSTVTQKTLDVIGMKL